MCKYTILGMKLFVKIKPRAKQEKIKQLDEAHFEVSVTEAPEKGRANDAVIKALAEHLKISQSRIFIISGHTSKQKVIEIY